MSDKYQKLLPNGSELLVNRNEIETVLDQLAAAINADYAQLPVLFITVMNGGLVFASELVQRLNIDLEMDYLQASRYRMETTGGILEWIARPRKEMKGRHVLIADDIYDEGHTLEAVKTFCEAQGAASVQSVVMVSKDHPRPKVSYLPEYSGMDVPDRYVFGFGMDYQEKLRQLPEIYALKESK